ncbi:MAG TPA: hypothetical protein VIJ25_01440, partial [Methylococcales bacterium]
RFIAFLIGIGFDILSVDPLSLPRVQKAIAQLDAKESHIIAKTMLSMSKAADIAKLLEKKLPDTGEVNERFTFNG